MSDLYDDPPADAPIDDAPTDAPIDDAPTDAPRGAAIGVKVLWVAIVIALLLLVLQVGKALTGDSTPRAAKAGAGEITVDEALTRAPRRAVAVRGYVFTRRGFPPQLCSGKKPGDPPRCSGPFLSIDNLDLGRLALKTGSDNGIPVGWTPEPIALLGQLNAASITVQEILR
ncbi:MAG TPA: hypothetical protein VM030_04840 [Acidimicrobiales bacterium]|nr:hypothetical protein [Acidimicrobiales bacterium]